MTVDCPSGRKESRPRRASLNKQTTSGRVLLISDHELWIQARQQAPLGSRTRGVYLQAQTTSTKWSHAPLLPERKSNKSPESHRSGKHSAPEEGEQVPSQRERNVNS